MLLASRILERRSNSRETKVLRSMKKPNKRIKMIRMGGKAKFVKNAVAPAKRSGSFFRKSLNADLKCKTNFFMLGYKFVSMFGLPIGNAKLNNFSRKAAGLRKAYVIVTCYN